jgi:hypothetical protein
MAADPDVATGPGPAWFRYVLVGFAVIYFWGLARESLHHLFGTPIPEHGAWLGPPIFFTQASSLFPEADTFAIEARLEAWSCETNSWQPLDPRPYFPIETDDKESRLQRLEYFYPRKKTDIVVMNALDDYIRAMHATGVDDGVKGAIGGIRLYKWEQRIPEVGQPPLHYHFDPFAAVPKQERKIDFTTYTADRKTRCGTP